MGTNERQQARNKNKLLLNQFVSPLWRSPEDDKSHIWQLELKWPEILQRKNIMIPPGSTDSCAHRRRYCISSTYTGTHTNRRTEINTVLLKYQTRRSILISNVLISGM